MDDVSSKRLALAAQNMHNEGYSDNQTSESENKKGSDGLGNLLRSVRQLAAGLMPEPTSRAKSKN